MNNLQLHSETVESNLSDIINHTYVFEGTEVKATGRYAKKAVTAYRNKVTYDFLIEVTPSDEDGPTWKRWVSVKDLYTVV